MVFIVRNNVAKIINVNGNVVEKTVAFMEKTVILEKMSFVLDEYVGISFTDSSHIYRQ